MSADNIIRPKYGLNQKLFYVTIDVKITSGIVYSLCSDNMSDNLFFYGIKDNNNFIIDVEEKCLFESKEALIKYLQEND